MFCVAAHTVFRLTLFRERIQGALYSPDHYMPIFQVYLEKTCEHELQGAALLLVLL
jgi:hypothetical protein